MAEYIVYYAIEDTDELMPYKRERIVRCRDCKHCEEYGGFNDGRIEYWCYSPRFEGMSNEPVPIEKYGFCAWGDRRSNG